MGNMIHACFLSLFCLETLCVVYITQAQRCHIVTLTMYVALMH